jgi:hypothetical protein
MMNLILTRLGCRLSHTHTHTYTHKRMIWGNPVWQGWKRSKALRDARETRREIIYMREATRKGRTRDLVRQSETLYKRPQLLMGVNMRHTEWHYFLCSCSWEFNKTWTVRFSSSRWSWKFITPERHNFKLLSEREMLSAAPWDEKRKKSIPMPPVNFNKCQNPPCARVQPKLICLEAQIH